MNGTTKNTPTPMRLGIRNIQLTLLSRRSLMDKSVPLPEPFFGSLLLSGLSLFRILSLIEDPFSTLSLIGDPFSTLSLIEDPFSTLSLIEDPGRALSSVEDPDKPESGVLPVPPEEPVPKPSAFRRRNLFSFSPIPGESFPELSFRFSFFMIS